MWARKAFTVSGQALYGGVWGPDASSTGWLRTIARYATGIGYAALYAGKTMPSLYANAASQASDWANSHPLVVFPVAVAAALHGDSGPLEEDAAVLENEAGELGGAGARATTELLEAIQAHGRTIITAVKGSEAERLLDKFGAEASVSGENHLNVILRPNPSKAAALEEFLHGTQWRLGVMSRLQGDVTAIEQHVADFMARHGSLLGLE